MCDTVCCITFMLSLNRLWLMDGWMDVFLYPALHRYQSRHTYMDVSFARCHFNAWFKHLNSKCYVVAHSMSTNIWFDFVAIVCACVRPVNGNDDDIKSPLTMDKLFLRDPQMSTYKKGGKQNIRCTIHRKFGVRFDFLLVIKRLFLPPLSGRSKRKSQTNKHSLTHTHTRWTTGYNIDRKTHSKYVLKNYEIHVIN